MPLHYLLYIDKVCHNPVLQKGIGRFADNMQTFICPWEADEFYQLYIEIGELIEEVDPAVVIVDSLFRPAIDSTRDKNRQHIILTPNTCRQFPRYPTLRWYVLEISRVS